MRCEEDRVAGILESHALKHQDGRYVITFAEGDSYLCRWDNGEYTDNGEEPGASGYDEWYELDYEVLETLQKGPNKNPGFGYIQVSRKHIPSLVTCGDEIVFDMAHDKR